MALDVTKYLDETDKLLDAMKSCVAEIRNPAISGFNGIARMSYIHGFLKEAKVNADKLTRHFSIQATREETARKKKAGRL